MSATVSSLSSFRSTWTGTAAALGAVVIWSGWIVATRHAVEHTLSPAAVGLLRFAVPALVFAPVWARLGLKPRGVSWPLLLGLMGSGAPFFLAVAYGMRDAPAADVGPLLPGTMPLFVALLSMALLGERPGRARLIGLALIAGGVASIGGYAALSGSETWHGHVLLLAGAAMWAVYTLAFKRSGLSAIEAAAVAGLWSTLMLLPLGGPSLIAAIESGLGTDVLVQTIIQGALSGVVAIVLYGVSVAKLGALRASAFVALVPALAAVLAFVVLGERPDAATLIGIAATTAGVALASAAKRPAAAAD